MTVNQDAEYHAAGFFGALNGTVKNIIFDNANVVSISAPNGEGNTDNGTAVVAGSIYTSGSIEGVTVKNSSVSGNRYVGGISGYTYGSVKNCTVENTTLTSTPDNLTGTYDNGDKAGGVVGAFWHENSSYEISGNTVKNVTVKGYRDIGGIAGYANGRVVDNSVNGLTLIQDYSIFTTPRTTVEAIIGRHDGFEVDARNTSIDVTVRIDNVLTNDAFSFGLYNKAEKVIINLGSDVTFDKSDFYKGFGGTNTQSITINGNGYKVTAHSTYRNHIVTVNNATKLVLNYLTFTSDYVVNGSTWDDYAIIFDCDTEMKKVTFERQVALCKAHTHKLEEVTINQTSNTGDMYALWIEAGADVTIKDSNIIAINPGSGKNRAIKIADEYVAEPQLTKLSVSGTTFKSQKKAAVLVTSTAGADITWGEGNDISGVAADSVNAVWNDSARTAAWNLVTVTGCTKFQET